MAAAMQISVDAAPSTVLSELNGILSWKEEQKTLNAFLVG